jgi:hypothetical protein
MFERFGPDEVAVFARLLLGAGNCSIPKFEVGRLETLTYGF